MFTIRDAARAVAQTTLTLIFAGGSGQLAAAQSAEDFFRGKNLNATTEVKVPDLVDAIEGPIVCTRTFPHLGQARGPDGLITPVNGKRIQFLRFTLDLECGTSPVDVAGMPAAAGTASPLGAAASAAASAARDSLAERNHASPWCSTSI